MFHTWWHVIVWFTVVTCPKYHWRPYTFHFEWYTAKPIKIVNIYNLPSFLWQKIRLSVEKIPHYATQRSRTSKYSEKTNHRLCQLSFPVFVSSWNSIKLGGCAGYERNGRYSIQKNISKEEIRIARNQMH